MKFTPTFLLIIAVCAVFAGVAHAKDPNETNVINKGWMKYFVYYPEEKSGDVPKAFFINSAFDA